MARDATPIEPVGSQAMPLVTGGDDYEALAAATTAVGTPLVTGGDNYEALAAATVAVSEADREREKAEVRELRRDQDARDRIEWTTVWQQRLILAFIGYVVLAMMVAGSWAGGVIATDTDAAMVDRAQSVVKLIFDSGIAAVIGFFAIKTFEK